MRAIWRSNPATKLPTPAAERLHRITKPKEVVVLPGKAALLASVRKALEAAPDVKPVIGKTKMLDFKIDGGVRVYNTKTALQRLYDELKSTPEKMKLVGSPLPTLGPGSAGIKPADYERIEELVHTPAGYVSDGRVLFLGDVPRGAEYDKLRPTMVEAKKNKRSFERQSRSGQAALLLC